MHPGEQQATAQVLGSLIPMQETWIEFQAPGSCLVPAGDAVGIWGVNQTDRRKEAPLFISFSTFQMREEKLILKQQLRWGQVDAIRD